MMSKPMKMPSRSGFSAPAANGMAVRGTIATETALCIIISPLVPTLSSLPSADVAPLEAPVVASMRWMCVGNRCCLVHAALHDLGERWQNRSCCAGLEGGSRD